MKWLSFGCRLQIPKPLRWLVFVKRRGALVKYSNDTFSVHNNNNNLITPSFLNQHFVMNIKVNCHVLSVKVRQTGYWKIPLVPEDKKSKTTFRTPRGLFQLTKMPFSLSL